MLKTLLTLIRINYHLYWAHPGKVLRLSYEVNGVRHYAIYDQDNARRITYRFTIETWRELSNRQINQLLLPYSKI